MTNLTVYQINYDDSEEDPLPLITFIDVPEEWLASLMATHREDIIFKAT